MEKISNLNLKKRVKEGLATMGLVLMVGATATACGKKPSKTPSEPTKIVNEVTPTDEVQPTNTVAPTGEVQPTNTVAPTATPTPTPIVSTVKTTTKPFNEVSDFGGPTSAQYDEIVSLGKEDILKYYSGNDLDEYDKVVTIGEFESLVQIPNLSKEDIKSSLDGNDGLTASDKDTIFSVVEGLEANGTTVPYGPLFLNFSDVKIVEGETMAFNPFTCTFSYNPNVMTREEALRYLVGYCTVTAYAEINGVKTLTTPSVYCFKTSASGNSKEIEELGEKFKKAIVQILVSNSKGEKIKPGDPYWNEVLYSIPSFNAASNSYYTYLDYMNGGYKDYISKRTPEVFYSASGDKVDIASLDGNWANQMTPEDLINNYIGEPVNFVTDNVDVLRAYGLFLPALKNMCKTVDNTDTTGFNKNDVMSYSLSYFTSTSEGINIDTSNKGYYIAEDGTLVITDYTPFSISEAMCTWTDAYYAKKDKNK